MNTTTPPTPIDQQYIDDAGFIRQQMLDSLRRQGKLTPENQKAVEDATTVSVLRQSYTGEQLSGIKKLFMKRVDYADTTAKNIIDTGKKASDTHIDLQRSAKEGEISIAKLASATVTEAQGITAKFWAGWAGPVGMVADILDFFGAKELASKCRDYAETCAQRSEAINSSASEKRLAKQRESVTIDTKKPVEAQTGVFDAALKATTSQVAGMTAADAVASTEEVAATGAALGKTTPYLSVPQGSVKPTSGATLASPANLDTMAAAVQARVTAQAEADKVKLTPQQAKLIGRGAALVDNGDNKSGTIDTEAEAKRLADMPAVKSLDAAQRATLWKSLGMTPAGEIVKPGVAGPVVSAPAPTVQ